MSLKKKSQQELALIAKRLGIKVTKCELSKGELMAAIRKARSHLPLDDFGQAAGTPSWNTMRRLRVEKKVAAARA